METTVTPKTDVKRYISMYFNVEYLGKKFSGALGTLKWPNEAKKAQIGVK